MRFVLSEKDFADIFDEQQKRLFRSGDHRPGRVHRLRFVRRYVPGLRNYRREIGGTRVMKELMKGNEAIAEEADAERSSVIRSHLRTRFPNT